MMIIYVVVYLYLVPYLLHLHILSLTRNLLSLLQLHVD